ncbi:hypothetical protein DL93DRAFT_2173502 [Clavulina sp. PMI_390]|nr:hypothetical protein DL93DRAFT_2173502 [Clavulina sp. PMI_390]
MTSIVATPSTDDSWPPRVWARSDLDGYLVFEAALRGDIPIMTEEPTLKERQRLTQSGQVLVWEDPPVGGRKARFHWGATVKWSASRMIGNYLTYRQMCPKNDRSTPRASSPHILQHDVDEPGYFHSVSTSWEDKIDKLQNDLFSAHRDHHEFPAGGLMRRTMTLKFDDRVLHLMNFFNPYDQISRQQRHPYPSRVPRFSQHTYDISPVILRNDFRRPAIINIVRYTEVDPVTGLGTRVERPVYGGDWGFKTDQIEYHFNAGRRYWAARLGVDEGSIDFFPENPRTKEDTARASKFNLPIKRKKVRAPRTTKKARASPSSSSSDSFVLSDDDVEIVEHDGRRRSASGTPKRQGTPIPFYTQRRRARTMSMAQAASHTRPQVTVNPGEQASRAASLPPNDSHEALANPHGVTYPYEYTSLTVREASAVSPPLTPGDVSSAVSSPAFSTASGLPPTPAAEHRSLPSTSTSSFSSTEWAGARAGETKSLLHKGLRYPDEQTISPAAMHADRLPTLAELELRAAGVAYDYQYSPPEGLPPHYAPLISQIPVVEPSPPIPISDEISAFLDMLESDAAAEAAQLDSAPSSYIVSPASMEDRLPIQFSMDAYKPEWLRNSKPPEPSAAATSSASILEAAVKTPDLGPASLAYVLGTPVESLPPSVFHHQPHMALQMADSSSMCVDEPMFMSAEMTPQATIYPAPSFQPRLSSPPTSTQTQPRPHWPPSSSWFHPPGPAQHHQ